MNFRGNRNRMSVLAVAVGLACGGSAVADQHAEKAQEASKYGNETQTQTMGTEEQHRTMEQERQSAQQGQSMNDKYGQQAQDRDQERSWMEESKDQRQAAGQQGTRLVEENVKSEKNISEFANAVEKAGLADALTRQGEYTVFAPTDEAFEKFRQEKGDVTDQEMTEVLRSHIVAGKVDADQAAKLDQARVLTGETVSIKQEGDTLKVGDAKVVEKGIQSGNLTIHTIDAVLAAQTSPTSQRDEEEEAAE